MSVPTRAELLAHLVAERIAGDVATPRESNLANIDKMLRGDWDYWFGLELERPWTAAEVFAVMVERVGIDPDPQHVRGGDRIDPQLTVHGLDLAAELLADVARRRGSVLVATGHPTGILPIHLATVAALRTRGCTVLTPAAGARVTVQERPLSVRYLGDVAMLTNGADLLHTHAVDGMDTLLSQLARDGLRPDLVVADHGWAGAAAQAGLPTIGFADCNDPALFVGAAEGKVAVAVPLDDNVPPAAYAPVADYLLRHVGPMR